MSVDVSIVIPVFNEQKILRLQIRGLIEELGKYKFTSEILLVENGSADDSFDICKKLEKKHENVRVYSIPKASYGQALKVGMLNSLGKHICIFNVDFFDVDFLKDALKLFKGGVDVVVGSKSLPLSADNRGLVRSIGTQVFNILLRVLLNYPGTDTHGIKIFRSNNDLKNSIHRCVSKNELVDTEILLRLHMMGKKVVELPVDVSELRPTRYRFFRRLWHTFLDFLSVFYVKFFDKSSFSAKKVIADDYGYSKQINKEILNYVRSGAADGVSVMGNMIKSNPLKDLKKTKVSVGLHLNLVEGRAVSKISKVKSLVDSGGNFYPLPIFLFKNLMGLIPSDEVLIEAREQLKKLKNEGLSVGFVNSHQHVHQFIGLDLEKELNIKEIRSVDSSKFYLRKKPFRRLVFEIFYWVFGCMNKSNMTNEYIVHPGTEYDY